MPLSYTSEEIEWLSCFSALKMEQAFSGTFSEARSKKRGLPLMSLVMLAQPHEYVRRWEVCLCPLASEGALEHKKYFVKTTSAGKGYASTN